MTSLLAARDLTRILPGEVPATLVRGVSLDIKAGEFVAIMGPSGSGKSSLLYLLGLLDMPTSGQITLDGQDISGLSENRLAAIRLARLGFVFQFHFLLPEFSALENIQLPMRRLGRLSEAEMQARGRELLASFDLSEHGDKRPGQLSGGQRQRVAVARALANQPAMILADEPTGNLDTTSSRNVRDLFRRIVDQDGRTVVAVTHDPDFAKAADRVIHIVDGQIHDGQLDTPATDDAATAVSTE